MLLYPLAQPVTHSPECDADHASFADPLLTLDGNRPEPGPDDWDRRHALREIA
jgi:hypothetical protein